jgi:hypothetical protein
VFGEIRVAVDSLEAIARALEPWRLDGRDAKALVEVAAQGERICASIKALGARRVEQSNVWRDGGHRSAAHWVAETTGATVVSAARTLETARALDQLPETDAAFRAGKLSETQASEITSTAAADPSAEAALLEAAASTSVKGLKDRCREVRAGAEVDDQAWARRLHEQRRAHDWTEPDGAYCLSARMAPDAGARFSSAWKAHIDLIFADARRAGRREPRAAYAADALVALASEGPCKPVEVHVTVDSSALARGHTSPGERCEIKGVGPAPGRDRSGAAGRCASERPLARRRRHHRRLVTEADDPDEASPCARSALPDLRCAVVRERPVPGDRSRGPDRAGGETSIQNAWRICSHHHVLKTYGGWVVIGEPGNWDLVPPDGSDPPAGPGP